MPSPEDEEAREAQDDEDVVAGGFQATGVSRGQDRQAMGARRATVNGLSIRYIIQPSPYTHQPRPADSHIKMDRLVDDDVDAHLVQGERHVGCDPVPGEW